MKRFIWIPFLILILGYSQTVKAALWDRGGGLIYDDDLNITWLQDARYAVTSGYEFSDTDSPILGYMSWTHAMGWVDSLEYYDSIRDVIWDDWRLPEVFIENNEWSGELKHLFYDELNVTPPYRDADYLMEGLEPFINVYSGDYWYNTTLPGNPSAAWDFSFNNGVQGGTLLDGGVHYAWAVRTGDVPIPGAVWLLGPGLVALVGLRKWKKNQSWK
jgi:hypothetical protein